MRGFDDLEVVPRQEFSERLEALLLRELGLHDDATALAVEPGSSPDLTVVDGTRRRSPRRWSGLTLAAAMVVLVTVLGFTVTRHRAPLARTVTVQSSPAASTTSAVLTQTSTLDVPQAAPGDLVPGTYRVPHFAVPFTFTSESDWIVHKSRAGLFDLITMTGPRLAVSTGVFPGGTLLDVVQGMCPGAVDFGPAKSVTLLDQPAIQLFGAVTNDCVLELASDVSTTIGEGLVLQVTVAVVDSTIVTVIAGALATVWPGSEAEVDHLIASMHPII